LCREHESVCVVCPPELRIVDDEEVGVFRAIGMDVHRDFCEVAILAAGEVVSTGRIETANRGRPAL